MLLLEVDTVRIRRVHLNLSGRSNGVLGYSFLRLFVFFIQGVFLFFVRFYPLLGSFVKAQMTENT